VVGNGRFGPGYGLLLLLSTRSPVMKIPWSTCMTLLVLTTPRIDL